MGRLMWVGSCWIDLSRSPRMQVPTARTSAHVFCTQAVQRCEAQPDRERTGGARLPGPLVETTTLFPRLPTLRRISAEGSARPRALTVVTRACQPGALASRGLRGVAHTTAVASLRLSQPPNAKLSPLHASSSVRVRPLTGSSSLLPRHARGAGLLGRLGRLGRGGDSHARRDGLVCDRQRLLAGRCDRKPTRAVSDDPLSSVGRGERHACAGARRVDLCG